jgi:glyoxylase I family protein
VPIELNGVCPLLQVFDMPTSIRFYRDTLGFEIVEKSGPGEDVGWVWLRRTGTEVMLNTAYDDGERPSTPDPARVASHMDTSLYFGCPDVDGAYRELRAQGLDIEEPVVQWYGMKQLTVRDPDGFLLVFQWPAVKGAVH